ncbi:MAG: hypothetical protein ACKO3K_05095 [Cuspidothrix sp.]
MLNHSSQNIPYLPFTSQTAKIILGNPNKPEQLAIPLAPTPITMFGPRAACLLSPTGPLWVSDTGHHRLLGWRNLPIEDNQPADVIIGQPDFFSEGQNGKTVPSKNTLSVPTGICKYGNGLAVADAWNHRILIWYHIPEENNQPADLVLGQSNFIDNQSNRGNQEAAANTLHWPYGILFYKNQLFVADTGNRRLLIWQNLPTENGQPADIVLGQPDMNSRNENGGGSPTASSMRWCHDITIWDDNLVVTDAGNNRIMIWQGIPTENNIPCAVILGQKNFNFVELNQGVYFPSSSSLSMPYGIDIWGDYLIVADTANSRLLGWKKRESILLLQGADADGVWGQDSFISKSENKNFGLPTRQSLNWCYGVKVCGENMVVSDSGNNRVLIW